MVTDVHIAGRRRDKIRAKRDEERIASLERMQSRMSAEGTRRIEARGPTAIRDVQDAYARAGVKAPEYKNKKRAKVTRGRRDD